MKRIKTILAAALVLVLAGTIAAPLAVRADEAGSITITIFHTNDMHGRVHQGADGGGRMGLDYVAAVLAAYENAILLDAGDTVNGIPFVNLDDGINAVLLMNAAGYSFMAPGNHDFNFGLDRLLELEEYADFGILAANVFWRADSSLVFTPYTTMEVAGVTIGFFGLATPTTPTVTNPLNVIDIYFGCPAEASELAVAALTELGVDLIVAISHLGYYGPYNTRELAEAVEGIDLIVDGHSHTRLPEGSLVNGTLIVQAYEHGRYLGRVDIVFADGEVTLTASLLSVAYVHENYEADEDTAALVEEMLDELEEILNQVVAYSPVFMEGGRSYVRTQETAIGNLAADAFRWASGADFAIVNGGAIRSSIEPGDLTMDNILSVLPFPNYVVKFEITPAILWAVMEHAVYLYHTMDSGRFPQISGFNFVFDGTLESGSRVLSITTADGTPLARGDTTTVYTLAIPSFMAVGGDDFAMFPELDTVGEFDTLSTVLINFILSDESDLEAIVVEGRSENVGVEEEEEEVVEEEPVTEVEPPIFVGGNWATVNAFRLNVRTAPDHRVENVIARARRGEIVDVLEEGRWGWFRVNIYREDTTITGWVFGRYLTF